MWILRHLDMSAQVTRSAAGKSVRKIRIGTIYPATIGVLPAFLSKIARKYPDIQLPMQSGSTSDIIGSLESRQINLGFIRPVENIDSLRFFSMANDEYLLAVAKNSRLVRLAEIGIEDLRDQKSSRARARTSSKPSGILPRCLPSTIWPAPSPMAGTPCSR